MAEPATWQYIPTVAVEAEQQHDDAQAWGDEQRQLLAQQWGDAQRASLPPVPISDSLSRIGSWATDTAPSAPPVGGDDQTPSTAAPAAPSPPASTPAPASTWAPSATARQTTGWTPPTTAGMSGGVPRTVSQTGGAFYGLDNQAISTVSSAGDRARSAGFGDDGARALQSVLVTEGGLTGARGDYGASAGPLQFLRDKGELPAFANYLGVNQDQAAAYAEQNPLEAIGWALGTPDQPGYLGRAIAQGQKAGWTDANLAVYAQTYGQRSSDPRRAGQWHNILFANGDPFSSSALAQRQTVGLNANQPGGESVGPGASTLNPAIAPQGANSFTGAGGQAANIGYKNQFQLGLSDADAYAACGPAAAVAFARAYGRNPTVDEAMQLAKASGWTQAGGMNGVANEQALLNGLGVQTKLEQDVDWSHVTQEASNGNPVVISTPGHYFYIDGAQQSDDGRTTQFHVGASGQALKGGSQWMSAADMQRLMGSANGALYADHPLAEGASITEQQPPVQPQQDTGLGGAFAAIGQKKDQLVQAVQDLGNQVQSPQTGNPLIDLPGTAASALGTAAQGIPNIPLGVSSEAGPATTIGDVGWGVSHPVGPLARALWKAQDAIANIPLGVSSDAGPAATVGSVASGVSNALRTVNPESAAARTIAGSDQWAREYADAGGPDLERELQDLQGRRLAGDDSVLPRIQQIGAQLNAINAQISGGQPYGQAVLDVAERNPDLPALEAGANLAGGVAALPLSAEAMPLAAKVAAEVLAPGSNAPAVIKSLGGEQQAVTAAVDQLKRWPGNQLLPVRATTPQSGTDVLQATLDGAKARGADPERITALQAQIDQLDPTAATRRALAPSTRAAPGTQRTTPVVADGGDRAAGAVGTPATQPTPMTAAQPANPYMLATEPGSGATQLSSDEVVQHFEDLGAQHEAVDKRIQQLEAQLAMGGVAPSGVVRPPGTVGWKDAEVIAYARQNGLNPYDLSGWPQMRGEGQKLAESRPGGPTVTRQSPTQIRAELQQLYTDRDQIMAAADHIMENGDATFYRRPEVAPEALPFDNGGPYSAAATTPAEQTLGRAAGANAPGAAANAVAPSAGPQAPASARAVSSQASAPATRAPEPAAVAPGVATAPADRIAALQASDAYQALRPRQQVQAVLDAVAGRQPNLTPATAPEVSTAARQGAATGQDLYGPTELAAGLAPQAVARSGARVFAPATQAPQPVQDALNVLDSEVRGAAARIDTAVGRSQITQQLGDQLYAQTKATGYGQFLKDVAQSPDGVLQKGAGVTRPAGWKDGSAYGAELSRTWLSPETATVVENIRDQVNGNTLADTLNAVNKGFGIVKEATLGGSTYHLAQETMQVARLTRENAPVVLARSLANAADPTGKLYQSFRTSSGWAPWFERAADAGLTMITRTPEGELVDLMRGAKGLAVRTGAGASAGFVKGYLGESDPQKRFEAGLKEAGLGAAFGAFGSYMVPALWERAVPTMKVMGFRTLVERGLSDQAAATMVNNTIGGENLVRIARSPLVQAAARATVFAPDWWGSWGRNLFRAINPADWSEVGKEAKAYTLATLVSGAVAVEGLNRLFAGHSALENGTDHLADVDMTRVWGPDPKTGGRQYLSFLGPVGDIVNASANPGSFLERRLGYIPNIGSELATGKTVTGYRLPNVAAELGGGKASTPTQNLAQRALAVAANQFEGLYPAGASSAQRMYEHGGPGAAAVSAVTGAREVSAQRGTATPPASNGGRPVYAPRPVP